MRKGLHRIKDIKGRSNKSFKSSAKKAKGSEIQ